MYGQRGRIALMLPYDNTIIEPEFARTLPANISAHVLRTTKTDRNELAEESLSMAPVARHLQADVALYACNASSFLKGRVWHDEFLERFKEKAGVPSESANSALMKLAAHRKLRRPAIVSPYPEWLLDPLRKFVTDFGFDVVNVVGLGLEPIEINRLSLTQIYDFAKRADTRDADGIIIVATNLRTLEILKSLEVELNKPVLSSNQALMWAARRMLKIPASETAVPPAHANWPEIAP